MEEAGRGEEEGEEEEEESPKELESEEEEMAMAAEGLGFLCYWLGRKKEFAVKKSRFGVRLNSEKMEDGSVVFMFYEELVAETLHLPWWLRCV